MTLPYNQNKPLDQPGVNFKAGWLHARFSSIFLLHSLEDIMGELLLQFLVSIVNTKP